MIKIHNILPSVIVILSVLIFMGMGFYINFFLGCTIVLGIAYAVLAINTDDTSMTVNNDEKYLLNNMRKAKKEKIIFLETLLLFETEKQKQDAWEILEVLQHSKNTSSASTHTISKIELSPSSEKGTK